MANRKFWRNRKVLVTGATGLIGSWLVKDLLDLDAKVHALVLDKDPRSELLRSGDIRRLTVINGRLENFSLLERSIKRYGIQTVIHLAAQTIVGTAQRFPLETFESNIRGTYNLLEACRLHFRLVKQVVVASSDKAYGAGKLPYQENMPLQGTFPYEVSKSCGDLLAQSYFHSYQIPVAIARCGNVYGGGDMNFSRIVPDTVRAFLNNKRPVIRSDGRFVRDYIYVKDISRAYIALAEGLRQRRLWGEAFNFSDEQPLTVLQIVWILQKLMACGRLKPQILNAASGEIRAQYLSAAKARRELGWKPQFTIEQGLTETVDWYHAFFRK